MQTITLEFPYNSRLTYTAIKNFFSQKSSKFSAIYCNDDLFVIEARHGILISPFSENVKVKVVASSPESCKVVIESLSRSILNLLNLGANKANVKDLSDIINNEVYKIYNVFDSDSADKSSKKSSCSTIRIVRPEIKFK